MDISNLTNVDIFKIVFNNSDRSLKSEDGNLQSRIFEIISDSSLSKDTKFYSQLNMLRESLNLSMVKTITMTLVELFELESVADLTDNEAIKKIFIEQYRNGVDNNMV